MSKDLRDAGIRTAIDGYFADMDERPSLQYKVLRQTRGEEKMKNKISVGLVVAIVLVLAAVTALAAITLNAYYEKALQKEMENGLIRDWETVDKVALVDWMAAAGIELDTRKVAALHQENLPEEEKDELAMEIIQGYYPARDGILSVKDIIAKEKGPVEFWSLEDKAWYSRLEKKYETPENKAGTQNLLPREGEITEEQAIEIAHEYFMKEFGLTDAYLASLRPAIYFQEVKLDAGGTERRWILNFFPEGDGLPIWMDMTPQGRIITAEGPQERTLSDDLTLAMRSENFWTIEGMYAFEQEWKPRVKEAVSKGMPVSIRAQYILEKSFGLPAAEDISLEDARKIAHKTILAMPGWTEEKLAPFIAQECFRTDDPKQPLYWFIYMYDTDSIEKIYAFEEKYRMGEIPKRVIVKIDTKTGAVVDAYESNNQDPRYGLALE